MTKFAAPTGVQVWYVVIGWYYQQAKEYAMSLFSTRPTRAAIADVHNALVALTEAGVISHLSWNTNAAAVFTARIVATPKRDTLQMTPSEAMFFCVGANAGILAERGLKV